MISLTAEDYIITSLRQAGEKYMEVETCDKATSLQRGEGEGGRRVSGGREQVTGTKGWKG